jgi:hypothetical protein
MEDQMSQSILNQYVDTKLNPAIVETQHLSRIIDFQNLTGPHSAVCIVQVICSTTSGSQYKFDVGVFCLPSIKQSVDQLNFENQ